METQIPLSTLVISPQATSPADQNHHTHQQHSSGPGFCQHELQSHPCQPSSHAAGGSLAAPASSLGPLAPDSPIASTSPIIVPQTRRGAIDLKKATSKTSQSPQWATAKKPPPHQLSQYQVAVLHN
ncbi:hypothetical protein OC846_006090 [Tilletia horrida]|uniref:Uncharacterized protein n=1 Tax=Tilletia horrida TaxID=155126 RepID=A0AAN6GK31_9BASI|nr:hypothetical protein OC846_006090 [Tilletia horrida]